MQIIEKSIADDGRRISLCISLSLTCIEKTRPPRAGRGFSLSTKSLVKEKKRKKWKAQKKKRIHQKTARAFVRQKKRLLLLRTLRPRGMPPKFILLYITCVEN